MSPSRLPTSTSPRPSRGGWCQRTCRPHSTVRRWQQPDRVSCIRALAGTLIELDRGALMDISSRDPPGGGNRCSHHPDGRKRPLPRHRLRRVDRCGKWLTSGIPRSVAPLHVVRLASRRVRRPAKGLARRRRPRGYLFGGGQARSRIEPPPGNRLRTRCVRSSPRRVKAPPPRSSRIQTPCGRDRWSPVSKAPKIPFRDVRRELPNRCRRRPRPSRHRGASIGQI